MRGGKGFDFSTFERTIGYTPTNWDHFCEALLHRSFLQYVDESWKSNERLEFLGDAVLSFLVADYLCQTHPTMEEGDLTKIRSRLVNRRTLAQRARELNLSEYLLLSTSAAQSVDSGFESILSDAFEAVVGALYIDGGIKEARRFVSRELFSNAEVMSLAVTDDNYKSALLEYAQGHAMGNPRYTVLKEEGPDHDRRFTVEVYLGMLRCGVGMGRSKREAEQAAAAQALDRILQNPEAVRTN
jgi:ribonuclease-3